MLKRRADAERDGDRIYAIVDAVAGSSDGRHLGLTAPRKEGQQRAVHRALAQSGVAPATIGLVEAHGTGTVVGDRTEMATLTEVFAEAGVAPGEVVLGSVKSQIGHTKCAAGLAGLIKVAKAVHHGVLPPTINLVEPNPYYDADTSPFRFLDRARPWAEETRRAGVSAFGFGGTNFHDVVSSYDAGDRPAHGVATWPAELFLVRGADAADATRTLDQLAATVSAVVDADPDGQRHALRDLAATVCRSGSGPVQAAIVADSLADLLAKLDQARSGAADVRTGVFLAGDQAQLAPADADDRTGPVVGFLYPGQGSQRPNMLAELFVTFGGLDDLLRLGDRWTDRLFPPAAFTREARAAQQEAITATEVAQPTLGIASLALTAPRPARRPARRGGRPQLRRAGRAGRRRHVRRCHPARPERRSRRGHPRRGGQLRRRPGHDGRHPAHPLRRGGAAGGVAAARGGQPQRPEAGGGVGSHGRRPGRRGRSRGRRREGQAATGGVRLPQPARGPGRRAAGRSPRLGRRGRRPSRSGPT
ncbi:MAG: ketoacyl-synthetase C-terminal extension domain-containing protein [Acidimicrobiales bacterium]